MVKMTLCDTLVEREQKPRGPGRSLHGSRPHLRHPLSCGKGKRDGFPSRTRYHAVPNPRLKGLRKVTDYPLRSLLFLVLRSTKYSL